MVARAMVWGGGGGDAILYRRPFRCGVLVLVPFYFMIDPLRSGALLCTSLSLSLLNGHRSPHV